MELSKLVSEFCLWQEITEELAKENDLLKKELKSVQKKSKLNQEAASASAKEANEVKRAVDKLHAVITHRCDLEEENTHLREEMKNMKILSAKLEETHCHQMTEAMENLQALSEKHKRELLSLQHSADQKSREELEQKDREIQDKMAEIRSLQREKAELERTRHTDIVKLRLEYDAKMLKLQKQQSLQAQCGQSSSAGNEIFRKKLQHARAEAEKEIAGLKRKVEELERQLKPGSTRSKRTRLL